MIAAPLVLLTRPRDQSVRFAERLAARWPKMEVVISPLQTVRFTDWQQPDQPAQALIFTSQNAVTAAMQAGLSGRAYCVGHQTAERAAAAGFDAISAGGDAADLVARIVADGPKRIGSEVIWHLRGREARGDVAGQLAAHGFAAFDAVVYEMRPLAPTPAALRLLTSARPVLLPLFSPKSARRAVEAFGETESPFVVLALSDAVARAASGLKMRAQWVARRPDADGMLEIVDLALNSGA